MTMRKSSRRTGFAMYASAAATPVTGAFSAGAIEVSIAMRVSRKPASARIARLSSMPFIPGIFMSITAT